MKRGRHQPMEPKGRAHPSGRPLPPRNYVELGFRRAPPDEPLTPGLRPGRGQTNAVGFISDYVEQDDD